MLRGAGSPLFYSRLICQLVAPELAADGSKTWLDPFSDHPLEDDLLEDDLLEDDLRRKLNLPAGVGGRRDDPRQTSVAGAVLLAALPCVWPVE